GNLAEPFLAVGIKNYASQRSSDNFGRTIFALAFIRFARISVISIHILAITQIKQGIELLVTTENNIPAVSAVSAIRAPARHMLFPAEMNRSGAAVAATYINFCVISKLYPAHSYKFFKMKLFIIV